MATRLFGTSVGDALKDVVQGAGSATAADTVELTIDLASTIVNLEGTATRTISKEEAIQAVERIRDLIIQNKWPPA